MREFITVNADGGVTVFTPSYDRLLELVASGMTMEQALEHLQQKYAPGSVALKPTKTAIDSTFRKAWKLHASGQHLEIDVPKAKEVAHTIRRRHRETLLSPHDKLATSPVVAIRNKASTDKQAILDADTIVQNNIDTATTAEQLKQILVNYGCV